MKINCPCSLPWITTWPTILKELNHYMYDGCMRFHMWIWTVSHIWNTVTQTTLLCTTKLSHSVTPDLPDVRFQHQGGAAPTPPESSTQLGCSWEHHWTLLLFHRCRGEGEIERVNHEINQFSQMEQQDMVAGDGATIAESPACSQRSCSHTVHCLLLLFAPCLTWKCAKLRIKNSVSVYHFPGLVICKSSIPSI